MMFWYGDGRTGTGWAWGSVVMGAGMLVLWTLVVIGAVVLLRRTRATVPGPPTPREVLAARFARGEIDESELTARLATLEVAQLG